MKNMGGQISIIKRHNGKIEGVSGYTNSFSNVVYDKDFFTDPNNKSLAKYMKRFSSVDDFKDIIKLDQYGLYIIDYDNKSIYNINGYSEYVNILTSQLYLDDRGYNGDLDDKKSPIRELYDIGMLCIRSRSLSLFIKDDDNKEYKEYKKTTSYIDLDKMEENFNSLNDIVVWLDGEKDGKKDGFLNFLKMSKVNTKKNSYITHDNGDITMNDMFMNLEKVGWKYYTYNEDIYGYVELYDQLTKDGYNITIDEIKSWDNEMSEDNETGDTLLSLLQVKIREKAFIDLDI